MNYIKLYESFHLSGNFDQNDEIKDLFLNLVDRDYDIIIDPDFKLNLIKIDNGQFEQDGLRRQIIIYIKPKRELIFREGFKETTFNFSDVKDDLQFAINFMREEMNINIESIELTFPHDDLIKDHPNRNRYRTLIFSSIDEISEDYSISGIKIIEKWKLVNN